VRDQILAAIRGRLRDRGLDAYIAYTPSNVFYATGFQSYFLMQWWRMQGMVLAIETPAYTTDAGAIMIEDLVHVLPGGIERLHTLPHGLHAIP
jgi:Xaa-Pro dipeptidase